MLLQIVTSKINIHYDFVSVNRNKKKKIKKILRLKMKAHHCDFTILCAHEAISFT